MRFKQVKAVQRENLKGRYDSNGYVLQEANKRRMPSGFDQLNILYPFDRSTSRIELPFLVEANDPHPT
jgi:hypothetical protein